MSNAIQLLTATPDCRTLLEQISCNWTQGRVRAMQAVNFRQFYQTCPNGATLLHHLGRDVLCRALKPGLWEEKQ